jgi:hypothetical protein
MDQQQAPQPPPQQQPQMPPQQQPQWSPPPQQPAGWGGPGYGAPPPRPTGVTLASIYLIVMGVLLALAGAACGVFGGAFAGLGGQDPTGALGFLGGMALVGGIIILRLGILSIASGAGALSGRGWARWTGVVISVVLAIFLVLIGISSLGVQEGATSGITSLVIGVLYALSAWALISASAWFAARR